MFLANSLNEKLKRSFSEIEIDPNEIATLQNTSTRKHGHPAILTVHKHLSDPVPTKLDILNKTEWEKRFTLPHLRAKWKEPLHLDFNPNHKKFPDDLITPAARKAKEYVKDLIDQDVLEVKNKRWNTSSNAKEKGKPELKKTIFEVNQGLNNFQVTKLRDNKVEEGVDSRKHLIVNGDKWSNSTLLENWEKKKMDRENIEKGQLNTSQYWNTTQYARFNEALIPISEERQKFEGERYYKKYKSPIQDTKERYKTLQKIKELTWIEREKVAKRILHNNPGSREGSEKINSLIEKEMYNTYQAKYLELTGRTKTKTQASTKVDWKDTDISDRIKTISDWRDVKWFKPLFSDGKSSKEDIQKVKKELLKPLVPQASIIRKEEDNIKDTIVQNYKDALKKDMLQKRSKAFSLDHTPMQKSMTLSKYPIEEDEYNKLLQTSIKQAETRDYSAQASMKDMVIDDPSNIIPPQQLYKTHYFLQAYKKVALQSLSKEKKDMQKLSNDKWLSFQFTHPGTFVSFNNNLTILSESSSLKRGSTRN